MVVLPEKNTFAVAPLVCSADATLLFESSTAACLRALGRCLGLPVSFARALVGTDLSCRAVLHHRLNCAARRRACSPRTTCWSLLKKSKRRSNGTTSTPTATYTVEGAVYRAKEASKHASCAMPSAAAARRQGKPGHLVSAMAPSPLFFSPPEGGLGSIPSTKTNNPRV